MSIVTIEDTNLTNIANAIRSKNGTSDTYKPSEMATAIENIPTGGGKFKPTVGFVFNTPFKEEMQNEIEGIDTSQLTNMQEMFKNGGNYLKRVDLSTWDVSKVTNMYSMFNQCYELEEIIFGENFITSSLSDMRLMFGSTNNLKKVDLSSFDTSKITNTYNAFMNSHIETLIIDNPNVFKITATNFLSGTPIKNGTGYIYVPDNLVEIYKKSTNWSTYASQFKGISELPEEV